MSKLKILFLTASPTDQKAVKVDSEFRKVIESIQQSQLKDLLEISSESHVRPDNLIAILQQHTPDIVHFSGHADNEIVLLENKNGESKFVDGKLMTDIFRNLTNKPKLVVLNACFTNELAQAIADVIGCAIGTPQAIRDSMAIGFSVSFYRNIAFGESIQKAFLLSIIEFRLLDLDPNRFPKIFTGKEDGDLVVLNKRRGYFLFSNYELWEFYTAVLDFSKQVHHMFQSLGTLSLNVLFSSILSLKSSVIYDNQAAFSSAWSQYHEANNHHFKDFSEKFPGYKKNVSLALTKLKSIDNIEPYLVEKIIACERQFIIIDKLLDKYKINHDDIARFMVDSDGVNKEIDQINATDTIVATIRNIKVNSNDLTTASDDLLRYLIAILLEKKGE